MQQLNCRRMSDYLAVLQEDRQSCRVCKQLMTVSISRFFRDLPLWKTLQQDLLPDLAARYSKRLTVWSAGCAAGEEVYSIKITWEQLMGNQKELSDLYLIATDMNRQALDRAREGVYRTSSLREMPSKWITDHFTLLKKGKSYRIQPSLQRGIVWMQHNFLDEPPRALFNIIFLRNNLLTYYRTSVQQAALIRILNQLSQPGLLVVGRRESCPQGVDSLFRHTDAPGVYIKR